MGTEQELQQEGGFRNVETGVNSKEYFDDEFESGTADKTTEEEAKRENESRSGKI